VETSYPFETFDALVGKVLQIQDITLGTVKSTYLVRYRGQLRGESEAAYDQLAGWLKPYQITPLFRWEEGRHCVLLVPGIPKPPPSNPMVNLGLAVLTLLSVLLTGGLYGLAENSLPPDLLQAAWVLLSNGWPFALSMLGILGCHEFGHYLMGRHHGVHVSLPYFIPFPFSAFGTMGAFINMKEPPKNRKILLDIGLAGPLAGLVVAVPVLLLGLSLSNLGPLQPEAGQMLQLEGNSILYLLAKFAVFGQLLPAPTTYGDAGPLLYWLRYFFTGTPLPLGGVDVMLHPVAWAGWAGLLVTTLNLIPAGQLDGGHVLYVLLGRERAKRILPFILAALVLLGFLWNGWWLWAGLIFFLGRAYAEPLDQITPLDDQRKALAVLALIVFILTFIPIPFILIG
jgi:membrane-associated protease RseP (regulator of RpoE activity)